MLVLAIDTALQRCSVAVMKDGAPVSVSIEDREKGHAERIAPMAENVFSKAGVAPRDLDRIGVVIGPGGFTGVRVGLSFARSLGLAAGVDVVGVTSLEALATGAPGAGENEYVASIIDARRNQVYAGLYRSGKELVAPFVASPEDAVARLAKEAGNAPVIAVGSGAGLASLPPNWRTEHSGSQIDPALVARLAEQAPAPDAPPAPLYLRAPDAKPPSRKPLAR